MNPYLIRKIIYPAYRAIKRDTVLDRLAEMRRFQALEPAEIRAYQWDRMKSLLQHAYDRVPYYHGIFKQLGAEPGDFNSIEDLGSFPVLRKKDVRENLDALVADGYPTRHLAPDETGGSTGQNLFFYVDKASAEARKANNARMNEWLGVEIGDKFAFLWGIRFRVSRSERLRAAIKDWFRNTITFSAYRMDVESVKEYMSRLRRFRPAVIMGYPSALNHLCKTILGAGLKPFTPRLIYASGETLYEWQRSNIEQAFGARLYNHYGSCEFGAVARECEYRNGLHIACDRVLLESVPVASTAEGEGINELIMTDLDDVGMPFIRYAIEDHGTLTWEPCHCGLKLPRLMSMAGRTYDVVRAPNGNYLGGTFWGHILKDGVEKFQVVQEAIDRIRIAIVPDGEFTGAMRQQALDKIRAGCGDKMHVGFEIVGHIEATGSGKHHYVISRIPLVDADDAADRT